jgi:hypothetical protein
LGNELVVNHISKYNYGTSCREDFNKGVHLAIDRKMDEIRKVYVAKNQMRWFLKRVYQTTNIFIPGVAGLTIR